jgi:hypothetical protein
MGVLENRCPWMILAGRDGICGFGGLGMRDLLDRLRDTIERHCVAPSTNRLPGLLLFRAEAPTTPMDLVMRTRVSA